MPETKKYRFAVVGAGVTGAWIARELTKYTDSVCILEKGNDVASGATKANSAIVHGGYDAKTGTLMAKLNVKGNAIIRGIYEELAIPFRQIGSLVVASNDEEEEVIHTLYNRGIANGIDEADLEIWDRARIEKEEPNLNENIRKAFFCRTAGVVSSFELCIAAAESAVKNGAEFYREFEVCKVEGNTLYAKDGRAVEFDYLINAAGVHADEIAALFGDNSFKIHARKGEYAILDNSKSDLVNHVIFRPPVKFGKGILVSQTVDENIIVGPTAENIDDKENKENTAEGLEKAFNGARLSVPALAERDTIKIFTGLRPIGDQEDFILGFSEADGRLINAAGIESPGLTAAPAIGEYIVELIKGKGEDLSPRADFIPGRQVVRFNELSDEEKTQMIKENPLYGRIICRCESITEGEIVDSIRRPLGAVDVDGVKRRVRAGMGRCQGGFCSPRVVDILARELNRDKTEITKFGGNSWIIKNQ
jgi:glycerol-3-phosphate dehydrogenase